MKIGSLGMKMLPQLCDSYFYFLLINNKVQVICTYLPKIALLGNLQFVYIDFCVYALVISSNYFSWLGIKVFFFLKEVTHLIIEICFYTQQTHIEHLEIYREIVSQPPWRPHNGHLSSR